MPDEAVIEDGLERAKTVLSGLETIAREGLVLDGTNLTLADLHLAPMIGFFNAAPEGAAALGRYPALLRWFDAIAENPAYRATCPPLTRAKP
ncbi:glutathione S-transferase domain-containing protein [Sedimentitalea todarodis]|uniref:Glutathione S-transferase domain-containing protein n=1 Tax=Sedimentitalea todarodis TaxID=1631240 RepID=A0ABU3VD82_9RHOB|nr:glutathione S-transferase domain-containing protein [Sedimentitalea todarodis]MDU9004140.1 glutathione S-transferase domain-containing protein [Sedimentitalea todarodis]